MNNMLKDTLIFFCGLLVALGLMGYFVLALCAEEKASTAIELSSTVDLNAYDHQPIDDPAIYFQAPPSVTFEKPCYESVRQIIDSPNSIVVEMNVSEACQ